MILKALKFCRSKEQKIEWCIEGKPDGKQFGQWLTLEDINLIVGKNASGKSRTVDTIRQIADLIAGDIKLSRLNLIGYGSGKYDLLFDDDNVEIKYSLYFKDGKIYEENLIVDGIEKLNRQKGILYYEEIRESLSFKTDDDVLALSRRDSKQQPFFENLYMWGKNLTHYRFGGSLGKDVALKDINLIKGDDEIDLKDGGEVTSVFLKGKDKNGQKFIDIIIKDMKAISYNIKDIDTIPVNFLPASVFVLGVREEGVDEFIEQREISQGMFRVLSLIIQLNFSLMSGIPSCILIDDIGEGLDYERSKCLIDLIIDKVKGSSVQVIMTTNDRFVMNKIPIEYWSVIQRVPKKSLFYNYKNSKETFDDFKYTGLNNFDFLATEFYITGLEEEHK